MKILLAGVLGGLVMFVWGAVSHMVLPIGKMGLSVMPNEAPVLEAMRSSIPEPGLYFFPGMDMSREMNPEERKSWDARYAAGPIGLLVYHPTGEPALSPKHLGLELLSNILAAFLAAIVVSRTSLGYGGRAMLVGMLGLFAWLSISFSYWNWYGFPTAFSTGEVIDQVVGWLLAGLALAAVAKPSKISASGMAGAR